MNEAMCNAVSEIKAGFLDKTCAKLKAQRFAEYLLGFSHTKDCSKDFDRLRPI